MGCRRWLAGGNASAGRHSAKGSRAPRLVCCCFLACSVHRGADSRRFAIFQARPGGDTTAGPFFYFPLADGATGADGTYAHWGICWSPSSFARRPSDRHRSHGCGWQITTLGPFARYAHRAIAGRNRRCTPAFLVARQPFLGFFAGGKLKKIDVSGGPPITLGDAPDPRSGTWNRDGVIIFGPTASSALQRVSAAGGVPTEATSLGQGETVHTRPFFLPDGRHFIYRTSTGPGGGPIYVAALNSAERKFLLNSDSSNVLYTQGHLLFLREMTLMAQPFDARRLALTGEAFPIAENIRYIATAGVFSVSENGVLAYQTGTETTGSQLVLG